jgi:hypothetical protein
MPKNQTSFKKGEKRVVRRKGVKNKRTILKESLGLTNFDKLASFIKNEGSEKLVNELQKLNSASYIYAWQAVAEFVKPKLTRVEYRDESPGTIPFDFSSLPIQLRKQILEHVRKNTSPADKRK